MPCRVRLDDSTSPRTTPDIFFYLRIYKDLIKGMEHIDCSTENFLGRLDADLMSYFFRGQICGAASKEDAVECVGMALRLASCSRAHRRWVQAFMTTADFLGAYHSHLLNFIRMDQRRAQHRANQLELLRALRNTHAPRPTKNQPITFQEVTRILRLTMLSNCTFCGGTSGILFHELSCRVCFDCKRTRIVSDADVRSRHGLSSGEICALNCLIPHERLHLTCIQSSTAGHCRDYSVNVHYYLTSEAESHLQHARSLAADMGWVRGNCACGGGSHV
ncbi:hypothetical protein GUITHDRAFT_118900 [Guillardia theta CCMP2712]|uniref:Uncharacterized protein n=1 Tax=Guillardia theta (strain CCMP2712) TaxID=905079 RepID=L1IFM2_GUITC|nr:hypothetical protein GUITHDRAFT_118900 [Guillardia theta CCMP2712]EKX34862.1 hypothetical protein GUITHDRAFT_118900 [Guillardia theta CCMP2712]|eukprot:XP_005821842.1 hypothetical protein GUITHDRAFT_118900 [Guillardia theta CCMP2712]